MAVTQSQIVDLLYKEAFGVTKTDTATNKSPSNESIPSPALNRGDTQWTQSDQIPGTATATAGIVQAYTAGNAVECTADNTTVPIGGIYPTWLTGLTYWIPTEFGATYQVQAWVDNPGSSDPTATGTQIFADGSGGTGQWYYNYQSGVLNFIGETIPAALTSGKVLYIVGYRYIGAVGVTNLPNGTQIGNLSVTNADISSVNTNANINLTPNGTGFVTSSANLYAPNFIGNVVGNISGNITIPGANTNIVFNDAGVANTSNAFTFDKSSNVVTVTGNLSVTDTANVGNLRTDNLLYANGTPWDLQQAAGSNTEIQYNIDDNFAASANFTYDDTTQQFTVLGNGQFNNANLGNLATANYVNVTQTINGNIANFSGNLTALNANLGNLATANFINVASNINVTGNVNAGNLVGPFANGNSNIKIYGNANIQFSVTGEANIATLSGNSLYVVGNINSTAGGMLANGNVTANGFLVGANANVTGEADVGSLKTANINATTGNITISAAGTNENITLVPTGTGAVDVSLKNIIQLANPVNPNDAATKEYVDNTAQGLFIHPSANVTSVSNLNATYNNGGTVLSVTTISGAKTITFSGNHGLAVDDNIIFTNSFNGIIAGEGYFVYSVPAADQITIKDGYFGVEVTTLTNATGLTEPALGNGGVGATLTNAGAQAALTIDGILMTVGKRVLVQGQTNQFENGIYDVTTVGTGATNWVLTRSSDGDSYQPQSDSALCAGTYLFITQGSSYAGASYVLTAPPGEIDLGVTNITFTQFSQAGSYTAGNGIAINGTTISANVDGVTTDISGGNIVVKTSANLTTPNIGDATFSSLTWNTLSNGNVTANNLSIGNVANITGNLTVDGSIQSNGTISSNANVSGANITTGGVVVATGSISTGANLHANLNLSVDGNTSITGNLNITGLTSAANINSSGRISANGNINSDGYIFANSDITATGNLVGTNANVFGLFSNTANVVGNAAVGGILTDNYYYANGSPVDFQQAAGSNTQIQFNNNNDFGASANFTFDNSSNTLFVLGNANITTVNSNAINSGSANLTLSANGSLFTFRTDGNVYLPNNVIVTENLYANDITSNGALSVIGNANVGNLGTAGLIIATGNITGGNLTTGGVVSATGNVSGGNVTTGGVVVATGNITGANLNTAGVVSATGNITGGNLNTGGALSVTGNANVGNIGATNFVGTALSLTANANIGTTLDVTGNANVGNLGTAGEIIATGNITGGNLIGPLANGNSNVNIPSSNGNITLSVAGNANVIVVTGTGANITGTANISGNANVGNIGTGGVILATGNITGANIIANISTVIGNTSITWATANTASITANQTIATLSTSGISAIQFFVKGVDSSGSKYSVATVQAVTDGTDVDFVTYGTINLGGSTGAFVVNITSGNVELQVTPTSSNNTVWTTQYRLM